ncbi:MAG: MlaD family protein [Elusimicrobiota bacterium]|nr:MlaD family protein [Endomicrobiia bacterium]MDW8166149.1 MlaD family protein [Elusimicrobiota bacterium]
MKKEFIVGLFLFIGLLAAGISIFLIRDVKLKSGYNLNLYFDDIGNLMERAWVRMRGVKIGRVERILIEEDKAKVIIWIDSKVKLYKGTKAKISSTGVLGVKYIEILQGDPLKGELKHNDSIYETESAVSIDNAISEGIESLRNFGEFLSGLSTGEPLSNRIDEILKEIEEISKKINSSIDPKEIKNLIYKINTAGENISEFFSEDTKEEINSAVLTLKNISRKLDEIVENIKSTETIAGQIISDREAGKKMADTLSSIKAVSEKAEKTLDRINLFRTYWDFSLRYDIQNDLAKSDVGIEIYPRTTKFYYLSVNNVSSQENSASYEEYNTFSIGLGGNFYNIVSVYGGFIKSYAGVGLKLFPLGYKSKLLEFGAEVYDFSKKRQTPRIDLSLKLKLTKWLYLGARYEDISFSEALNAYLNISFEDEDIAYLLGLIGLSQ